MVVWNTRIQKCWGVSCEIVRGGCGSKPETYFVMPEVLNCTGCDNIAFRYIRDASCPGSDLISLLSSSLDVAPAPTGVPVAETTPAFTSVERRSVKLLGDGAAAAAAAGWTEGGGGYDGHGGATIGGAGVKFLTRA